jgi:TldD protein
MGERVAPESVTLVDDPRLDGGRVHLRMDDEGVVPERRTLIDSGVLRGFLSDRRTSEATSGLSTGNARRESYRHPPLPRMTNLVLEACQEDPADLINRIPRGLWVERLGRGQVDPHRGLFRLEVQAGRLIEGGVPGRPIAGAFLVGSCAELLSSINGVGGDLRADADAGVCIKEDQIVPVGQAAPSVSVSQVAVLPGTTT